MERLVVEDREALERRARQGGAEDRVLPESRRAGHGQVRGFPKNSRVFRRNESEVAQSITSPGDEGRGECLSDEASGGGDIGMDFSFRLQHIVHDTRINLLMWFITRWDARAGKLEQALHSKLNWSEDFHTSSLSSLEV